MNHEDELHKTAREHRSTETREEKWNRRGKSFWSSFLFTKDGRPKSSLLIYTFSLSILFVLLFVFGFYCLADLTEVLSHVLPVFLSNLAVSLIVSAAGICAGMLFHHLAEDKRLFFGTYLWLSAYLLAAIVVMLLSLKGSGDIGAVFAFFFWFFAIPVLSGLAVSAFFYNRDHVRKLHREAEPEDKPWKKYTERRD